MDPPEKPNELDCCNSGCNPCIFDVYEKQLEKFEKQTFNSANFQTNTKNCISQTTYSVFKLVEICYHTHSTRLLTFQFVRPNNSSCCTSDVALIYKPGQHLLIRGNLQCNTEEQFTRAYTPIPFRGDSKLAADHLCFTVLVKLYEAGLMSNYIQKLKVDDETVWRGPYGDYEICYDYEHVLLIAQGTGIAPLFAIIKDILDNTDCESFLKLYFCCRTADDILLRNELYTLSSFWNFSYEIFLSNQEDSAFNCKYKEVVHLKRLNEHIIKTCVEEFHNKSNIKILVCGSEKFNESIFESLVTCNIDKNKVFIF